jgi:hypothetical protein
MSIEISNDGTTTNAMALTNRWTRDFDNSNNETGTKYLVSTFNSNGDVDEATGYTIVSIDNWC